MTELADLVDGALVAVLQQEHPGLVAAIDGVLAAGASKADVKSQIAALTGDRQSMTWKCCEAYIEQWHDD